MLGDSGEGPGEFQWLSGVQVTRGDSLFPSTGSFGL